MAMFDKPVAGSDTTTGPGTIVGGNVKLTGTLKDVNDITVHGQVEGEIISDRVVTIAETAKVKGPITATTITIAGLVNGAISASERCELLPSARVTGSIATADLSIRSGAVFNGKSTMSTTERPEPTRSDASESLISPEPTKEPAPEAIPAPVEETPEPITAPDTSSDDTSSTPTAEFED